MSKKANIKIDTDGYVHQVILNGKDISKQVNQCFVDVSAQEPAIVELRFPGVSLDINGYVDADVDGDTARALKALGWKPPSDEV